MNKRRDIRLVAALSIALVAGPLLAQTPSENQTSSDAQPAAAVADAIQLPSSEAEQPVLYVPALNGSGLISMDGSWQSHILLGTTVGGGWDSMPDNLANGVSSGMYTVSPYLGIKANTAKAQYLIQYQPTIRFYSSSNYNNQVMNVASAKIVGNINERWNWDLNASGSHGQDSIRFLAPQQTVAIGGVPGTGPNSASYLPNAGTVTYIDGGVDVRYRKSERDTFNFGVADAFNRFAGLSESSSTMTASLVYERALSPQLGMNVYGQSTYYYGALNCMSFGGGLGLKWQVSERTSMSLSGGPQLDTPACGSQQGFSYSAAFSTRLSSRSQIYLVSARQPTVSYLGPGLWQTSASGGYQRQVMSKGTLGFDLGYVESNSLAAGSSYRGTYVDGTYGQHIGHGLTASLSYRGYMGNWQGVNANRNVAMFSLAWAPASWAPIAGRIFQ